MKFEIEISRNNVTPAQFLAYCRSRVDAKGGKHVRADLDLDYFKLGDDLNFNIDHKAKNDECYTEGGCEYEKSVSKPYEMQTYIRYANGAVYNEICEFDFDDEKTGHGYYYLVNVDAEEVEKAEKAEKAEEAEDAEETETAEKRKKIKENWFDDDNSKICTAHRTAYEKSLKCNRAVKVHSGEYYYKGYNISKDGGTEFPWNYGKPSETGYEGSAETKALAMQYIDDLMRD